MATKSTQWPKSISYLIEYSEDWMNERSYIKQEKLIIALDGQEDLIEAQAF